MSNLQFRSSAAFSHIVMRGKNISMNSITDEEESIISLYSITLFSVSIEIQLFFID